MFPQVINIVRIVCGLSFLGGLIMVRFMDIQEVQPFFKRHKILSIIFVSTACVGCLSFTLALIGV